MPELPEVELVRRSLEKEVEGAAIEAVAFSDFVKKGHATSRKTIVKQELDAFSRNVEGATISKVGRRGKYLYFIMEKTGGIFHMISHLGMSGAFFVTDSIDGITDSNYRKHWQVAFRLQDGRTLSYCDIRRFGEMLTIGRMADFPPFNRMAVEYTHPDSLPDFIDRVRAPANRKKAIKAVIMDSTVIPGVGNIYASEALFASGILPTRKAGNVSVKRLMALHKAIAEVFDLSIESGGSTISDYRGVSGEKGSMQDRFHIYQKKSCSSCGGPVKTKTIATRNTFYCTKCQR
ncbi:bifunctional DNA-formamidopyrimidine glycosylase/DNA-(apurinic or apyrimidinic site) lyase [Salinicoccus roseus]|jgi:formamidopyrimidine-DNA glycosylase|uniref:bifunctional DNA-formamidopyrimidine glycosylase/DNA-(apurinic or apyrimidinic site) lyase n=1 Tax=Salinicoccus roseus TaxID=45670 RepID=UPI000F4E6D71|nr:bifunctional DNA-formamidopyrimidine glycosylase/DNA-(apurinic or apyrimidinic site) lyase [Salinicoccus roseus]MBY8908514.1 bifunctional DNA-formamidopyrimidine glycosylase/DNA-(apurinic or apyrimidinic site) lyase [Salinicoccus roseus]RPE53959.1 DNA-(apurinic or apyrimidinic site) lyase [Salinicoccus roseus]GGA69517.1 formamidopyrimidine-DNA glycosylase [Salinicoccus roseus]